MGRFIVLNNGGSNLIFCPMAVTLRIDLFSVEGCAKHAINIPSVKVKRFGIDIAY